MKEGALNNYFAQMNDIRYFVLNEGSLRDEILANYPDFSSWLNDQISLALDIEEDRIVQVVGKDRTKLMLKMSDFDRYSHFDPIVDVRYQLDFEIKRRIYAVMNKKYGNDWSYSDWIRRVVRMGLLRPNLELEEIGRNS